jgi:hypothetical protein
MVQWEQKECEIEMKGFEECLKKVTKVTVIKDKRKIIEAK